MCTHIYLIESFKYFQALNVSMIVVGGSSSIALAREVSEILGSEFKKVGLKRFPDGEGLIKVEGVAEGETVAVIQSTHRPQDENLMELFFVMDALRDANARVTAVLPYYGYGRQDRAFTPGEAISAKTIANHIGLSAERFVTVNPHKEHILGYFQIPSMAVDASSLIGNYFKEKDLDHPVVVAPDSGSKILAQNVADAIGCPCANCVKKRIGPGKVLTSAERISLDGQNVIIVDDIIDSGGTIVEAANALKKRGAGSIKVACIHPVLTGKAASKILEIADELVSTNTIPTEHSKVSVAGLLAEAIKS